MTVAEDVTADVTIEDEVRTVDVDFELIRSEGDDGLTLSGYAAVFNSPTRIDSWEGEFDELIAPGAFKRTIRSGSPVMQFDHGQHPLIGSLPIASIKRLREDARGLYVEARVFDNWLTEPLRDAIREEAIKGMSFRFSTVKDDWDRASKIPVRTLREVKLYELGPVIWPAYSDTTLALRSLQRAIPDLAARLGTPERPATEALATDSPAQDDPAAGHSSTRTKNQRRAIVLLSLKERS
jgi:HK97 family phage prohead protease